MIAVINGKATELKPGMRYFIDGKTYVVCLNCGKLVRVDKPLFGALHFCE